VLDLIERERGLTGAAAFEYMRSIGCDVDKPNGAHKRNGKKPPRVTAKRPEVGSRPLPGLGVVVAKYHYRNKHGEYEFEVIRFDPKAFRQGRMTSEGFVWSVAGAEFVPFRLPELIEGIASDQIIYLCEGEKDVLNLKKHGLCATTNAGGAVNWKPELNEYFRGADVVIIPDHDDAGRRHLQKVAAALKPVAKRVRVLELWKHWPEMEEKDDVSDWLEAGHTREQLDALIEQAPDYAGDEQADAQTVTLDDFRAYAPTHQYIYTPTRELWTASSVDSRLTAPVGRMKASTWLDRNRSVEQMTWAPGLPMLIPDKVVADGGWSDHAGVTVFNLYKPPTIVRGDAAQAGPWIDHVHRVYPDDAKHIIAWLAHRVQRPHEKINHGLVLGGEPGIGKDTIIEPVKRAVGPWNVAEVSPTQMLGRFNGFIKSVILRVSEARDLGEMNRFALYEHMKVYLASPPDVIRCDEKNIREHSVFNICGVIITSNRKDSFFLPADDRRHYVAWSDLTRDDFDKVYWDTLWDWYNAGGDGHVAAYLAALDLADFHPKAPPAKTPVFWEIVQTNRSPEDSDLADALAKLDNPTVVTINLLRDHADSDFAQWLKDRRNARAIPHRLEDAGYVSVRNPAAKDGMWKIMVSTPASTHGRISRSATGTLLRPTSKRNSKRSPGGPRRNGKSKRRPAASTWSK
jgi:hypothetical protein